MMMHIPGVSPGRTEGIMQPVDIFPTVCELLSISPPQTVEGSSVLDLASGKTDTHRSAAVTSGFPIGGNTAVTDGRWVLHIPGPEADRLLFDLENDPGEQNNILTREPDQAERLMQAAQDELGPYAGDEGIPL
jgi:arylsulfatase A-like enzyme